MQTIKLPMFDIVVTLTKKDPERPELYMSGVITSSLKEVCEFCDDPACDLLCENAQEYISDRDFDEQQNKSEEIRSKERHNNRIDIVESMILAQACQGIDIESKAYLKSLQTVLDKIGNLE